jgi:hypothetical protein
VVGVLVPNIEAVVSGSTNAPHEKVNLGFGRPYILEALLTLHNTGFFITVTLAGTVRTVKFLRVGTIRNGTSYV